MKILIYAFRNTVTGDAYVGSTVDLRQRKALHVSDLALRKNRHPLLQAAWDEYGDVFEMVVLETVQESERVVAEQRQINAIGTYNIRSASYTGRPPGSGTKHSRLTPSQRTLRARVAGYARASKATDPAASTEKARGAFLARFMQDLDPTLPEHIRQGQAEYARKQYFTLLAFKSSVARSRKG